MQKYGCLFCKTGGEVRLAEKIGNMYTGIEAIVPQKLRYYRYAGQRNEEKVLLFPSYIFIKTNETFALFSLSAIPDVYRILSCADGCWHLSGNDEAFAKVLFDCGGCVGFSKAHYVGERISISEGFLKGREGDIVRVNRKAGTAQVKVILDGKVFMVWCGLDFQDGLK